MIKRQGSDEWQDRTDYRETFFKRAKGQLPEMECSKAVGDLLAKEIRTGDSLLDVGCGAGHYLRLLLDRVDAPFTYQGVDATPDFIELEPALPLDDRALADQPRQLLPQIQVHSGHLDVIRRATLQGGSMTGDHLLPLDVPPRYYFDIDTPEDLERAAWVLERTRGEIDLPGA